jgi:hypothetical protein
MASVLYTPKTTELIKQIGRRVRRGNQPPASSEFEPYLSVDFEDDIARLLGLLFPFSVLSSIRIFSSEQKQRDFGYEVDNTFHIRREGVDYIVTIEAKNQPVKIESGRWLVAYHDGPKCCREQVENHIRTLWEYLGPIPRDTELKFIAIVVSSDSKVTQAKADGYRNAELILCNYSELPSFLNDRFGFGLEGVARPEIFRVPQSRFLDLLRLGQPVEHLGHPELLSAIRYVERCRRSLDESLFRLFEPKLERWAINGSAGMGKSVLLAYSAAVLSSGYELAQFQGDPFLVKANKTFESIKFVSGTDRTSIAIMAMSAKQLANLEHWFSLFVQRFQRLDTEGMVRFRPPEFVLCRGKESFGAKAKGWAALLVDEAHDLPAYAAQEIASLYNDGGLYLIVACDRHQKLRLASADARIIEGLDFSLRSTRLRQIYRNPAAVYIASLSLMFRWFAQDGPKILPTLAELDGQFGFLADRLAGSQSPLTVRMLSDAHPANSWCHTVETFPDVTTAYEALAKENLGFKEVLWVRFASEDPDFDYEKVNQHFTYHVCGTEDGSRISDKYIKGQDYPVVVVEGFPEVMDRYESEDGKAGGSLEAAMWAFRREVYLCASRATAFLYFVCNGPKTPEAQRIQNELQEIVKAVAMPRTEDTAGGTKCWMFQIKPTRTSRSLSAYLDAVDASPFAQVQQDKVPIDAGAPVVAAVEPGVEMVELAMAAQSPAPVVASSGASAPIDSRPVLRLPEVVTPRILAGLLGDPPVRLLRDLLVNYHLRLERDTPFPRETAAEVCEARGFRPVSETP